MRQIQFPSTRSSGHRDYALPSPCQPRPHSPLHPSSGHRSRGEPQGFRTVAAPSHRSTPHPASWAGAGQRPHHGSQVWEFQEPCWSQLPPSQTPENCPRPIGSDPGTGHSLGQAECPGFPDPATEMSRKGTPESGRDPHICPLFPPPPDTYFPGGSLIPAGQSQELPARGCGSASTRERCGSVPPTGCP